jgi:hypothetical protein
MGADTESTPPTASPEGGWRPPTPPNSPGSRPRLVQHPGHEGQVYAWMSWPPSSARPRPLATAT